MVIIEKAMPMQLQHEKITIERDTYTFWDLFCDVYPDAEIVKEYKKNGKKKKK